MAKKFIITEEQIKEINQLAFRNFGIRITKILNSLPQMEEENEINETKE